MLRSGQRKELKSSIKKSWILDKAGMLFWQKGYHGTSMKDIAAACDCKAANIYNYFIGKEDILFEVIKDITERAVNSVRHLEDDETGSPVEQLRSFIDSHLGVLVQMKNSSVLLSDTGLQNLTREHRKIIVELRDTYDRIMRKIIIRGVESGDFAVGDEKVIVYLISSVIIRTTIWFSPKGRLSADEIADIIFDFVYRGIKA
ncbi:MAG: TetR family transcriptional regulator [Dehalococcoidales bacterium]|nr:MAG: TetR family transcriptional regulator [Dehalococcoidales bacterium]